MNRLVPLLAVTCWVGATLLVAELRVSGGRRDAERLRAYVPRAPSQRPRPGADGTWSAMVAVLAPLAVAVGDRLSSVMGVNEELQRKLDRLDMGDDVASFRLRQSTWAVTAGVLGAMAGAAAGLGPAGAVAALCAATLLAFLLVEQRLVARSERWQERVRTELPVVAEQLGVLLCSGYSLGGAVARAGGRGSGVMAHEFRRTSIRIRQGVGEVAALREMADRAGVASLDRLVGVLALNHEASDLGPLIAAEARLARRDAQRATAERIERKAQQVWIPVTVATLLPGVIFIAVPFVDAMSAITGR